MNNYGTKSIFQIFYANKLVQQGICTFWTHWMESACFFKLLLFYIHNILWSLLSIGLSLLIFFFSLCIVWLQLISCSLICLQMYNIYVYKTNVVIHTARWRSDYDLGKTFLNKKRRQLTFTCETLKETLICLAIEVNISKHKISFAIRLLCLLLFLIFFSNFLQPSWKLYYLSPHRRPECTCWFRDTFVTKKKIER